MESNIIKGEPMQSLDTHILKPCKWSLHVLEITKNLHSRLKEGLFHQLKIGRERDGEPTIL